MAKIDGRMSARFLRPRLSPVKIVPGGLGKPFRRSLSRCKQKTHCKSRSCSWKSAPPAICAGLELCHGQGRVRPPGEKPGNASRPQLHRKDLPVTQPAPEQPQVPPGRCRTAVPHWRHSAGEITGDGYKVFTLNSLLPKEEYTVHLAKMSYKQGMFPDVRPFERVR
jgi:hypothetical protein